MKRLLLLLPLFAVLGCDPAAATTAPRARTSSTPKPRQTSPLPVSQTTGVKTTEPESTDPKDPPIRPPEFEERKEDPPEEAPPIPASYKALNKNKTIFFEKKEDGTKRVHLLAEVCLREGPLEVFLCKNNTKEHESIVHVDADGREIHFALVAAGATPGTPVKFQPRYQVATGDKIKISLTYRMKGKVVTAPAADWVKDKKTNKHLAHDWVFAGSKLFHDPDNPNAIPFYLANNGELISLSNFPDSMLDLPVKSSKDQADLIFEVDTERVPPLRTPVLVTLEPVLEKKK
jgi:hypothetical protein